MDLFVLAALIIIFSLLVYCVYEVYKDVKKYKQKHNKSHKELIRDFFSFLSSCIKFLLWICIVVGPYILAIFKWSTTSHIYFWTGFKELIWALIPIFNIFYIL